VRLFNQPDWRLLRSISSGRLLWRASHIGMRCEPPVVPVITQVYGAYPIDLDSQVCTRSPKHPVTMDLPRNEETDWNY